MSSTSSSECLCSECFNYGSVGSPIFRTKTPYFQNLGHPLIYYAQVQQNPNYKRRSKDERQERPNCFVKAFRWYTQERCHPQSRELPPSNQTDLSGFAVWLDKKYDEFILDKRTEQNDFQGQLQCTTLEANKNSSSVVGDLRVKKKFARMRSPWRKRRHGSLNSKESGDVSNKFNQSFEFIMKPKELSRPASECCRQTSHNQSFISAETQASKKTIIKSYSSDRTYCDKHICTPVEVIKLEGNSSKLSKLSQSKTEIQPRLKPMTKDIKDKMCQCMEKKVEVVDVEVQCTIIDITTLGYARYNDDRNANMLNKNNNLAKCAEGVSQVRHEHKSKLNKHRASNSFSSIANDITIACQCSEFVAVKKDAPSQRDPIDAECRCSVNYEFKYLCQDSSKHHQNQPGSILEPCPCVKNPIPLEPKFPVLIKDVGTDTAKLTPTMFPITYASGEAQTSNHSICIDKNTYPLFMKIVCADKLNEEFTRK